MFETFAAAEVDAPPGFVDPGNHLWSYCFRRIQTHWFYAIAKTKDRDGDITSLVFFFSNFEGVQNLNDSGDYQLAEVYLITPNWMNKSRNWKMEKILRVLEGDEPDLDTSQTAQIYVLENGLKITHSAMGTVEGDLNNIRMVLKF